MDRRTAYERLDAKSPCKRVRIGKEVRILGVYPFLSSGVEGSSQLSQVRFL